MEKKLIKPKIEILPKEQSFYFSVYYYKRTGVGNKIYFSSAYDSEKEAIDYNIPEGAKKRVIKVTINTDDLD